MAALATGFLVAMSMSIGSVHVQGQESNAELKKLLKERSNLLDGALSDLEEFYKAGAASLSDVFDLSKEAFHAKLELAEGPEQRIEAVRAMRNRAEKFLKIVE